MTNAVPHLFIFGSKSTAIEIAETTAELHPDWKIVHVSDKPDQTTRHPHVLDQRLPEYLQHLPGQHHFILSMSAQKLRAHYLELANSVHLEPQTTVSPSAVIGTGCYIAPGCRISSQTMIGDHSILNLNITLGHNTTSGGHLTVNLGAAITGNVNLGNRVLVGANAFVGPGLTIGDDCQIDAMAYVGRDLPPSTLCTSRQFRTVPRLDHSPPIRDAQGRD